MLTAEISLKKQGCYVSKEKNEICTVVNRFRESVSYHPTCIVDGRRRIEHDRLYHAAVDDVDLQRYCRHVALCATSVK